MELYQFTLRFDDEEHQLTAQNGLGIDEVSLILAALSKATKVTSSEKIVLSEIKGNCYALEFTTSSVTKYETLKVIHRKIGDSDFSGLSNDELSYVSVIKDIIDGRYNFKAYNPGKDFIISVDNIILPEDPEFYFDITTVTGVVVGIGGKTIEGKSSISLFGVPYQISVSASTEKTLLKYFKKNKVSFVVKRKIKFADDSIISAELESFEVSSEKTFGELAEDLEKNKKSLFKNIKDTVKSVRSLR